MTRPLAILLSGPLVALLLFGARGLPLPGLFLALLAALSVAGGYAKSLSLRRSLIAAALEPGTRLRHLLTGRLTAAVTATLATALTVTAAAYAAITGTPAEAALLAAATISTAALVALLERPMDGRVVPRLKAPIAEPAAVLGIGAPFAVLHMWIGYDLTAAPAWLDLTSLTRTLSDALTGLPQSPLGPIFDAIRLTDAATQWLVAQPGGTTPLTVVLMLAKGAAFMFSAAKLTADVSAATTLLARRTVP